jgi:acyl-coenzyme A thioesterase PaaI-like protein
LPVNIKTGVPSRRGGDYDMTLARLRETHHSKCLFNRQPSIIPGLQFSFDKSGVLTGEFVCNGFHQGYDGMVHGGVIASIIDASMAQCLMGHGIVGYTVNLSVKYRKPIIIRKPAAIKTFVSDLHARLLYTMKCEIVQDNKIAVKASGHFFKVK